MTPTEIKSALAELGGRANKRLGQHFLISQAVLDEIVSAANIKSGDLVLEIGPGLGVLTRALLDRGAEVIAIEQDRRFVEWLTGPAEAHAFRSAPDLRRDREKAFASSPVTVIHGDAATVHWHDLIGDPSTPLGAGRPWKFVSNLPYSITSLALRKVLWAPRPADLTVALVQREVAERAVAKNGKTSLLFLMVALASNDAEIIRRVPPGAFYPPPKVESAVLRIVPLPWPDREKKWGLHPDKIMELAKRGFAHPRKLLASNLGVPGTLLSSISLSVKARAEDLSPQNWAKLALAVQEIAS